MGKIAFFEIEEWEKRYFEKQLGSFELSFEREVLDRSNLDKYLDAEILSTFIYSKLDQSVLSRFKQLKMIATRSTGFDHVDLEYCKAKGIKVCNVPVYGEHTVAEHTFVLILAISRKLIPSVERVKEGNFSLEDIRGFELYGKTIGLLGLGNIGKVVARIALGFGMQVLAYSRHPNESLARELKVKFVDLEQLFVNSDIVSLHLPYSKQTHHLINQASFQKFKRGSVLINTARGGIVDSEALVWALNEGILAGAGLDVLEEECALKEERQLLTKEFLKECNLKTQLLNHILISRKNVVITPHNAFNSTEALQRILDVTLANVKAFSEGKILNSVTFHLRGGNLVTW